MTIRYLLDTNICIYIAKHNPPEVRQRFARHNAQVLAMSVITWGELNHGAEKSQRRVQTLATLQTLASLIQVVPLSEAVGQHYGQIRSALEQVGTPIGNNDLWIAAHARSNGWVLVTNNEREFRRVDGLVAENWVVG